MKKLFLFLLLIFVGLLSACGTPPMPSEPNIPFLFSYMKAAVYQDSAVELLLNKKDTLEMIKRTNKKDTVPFKNSNLKQQDNYLTTSDSVFVARTDSAPHSVKVYRYSPGDSAWVIDSFGTADIIHLNDTVPCKMLCTYDIPGVHTGAFVVKGYKVSNVWEGIIGYLNRKKKPLNPRFTVWIANFKGDYNN